MRLAQLHLWDKTAQPVVDLAKEERTVDGPSDETYHSQGLQLGLLLSFADRGPKHSHTENEQCQNAGYQCGLAISENGRNRDTC